jgi:hypothetical protein
MMIEKPKKRKKGKKNDSESDFSGKTLFYSFQNLNLWKKLNWILLLFYLAVPEERELIMLTLNNKKHGQKCPKTLMTVPHYHY